MNFRPSLIRKEEEATVNQQTFEPITKYMATDLITFNPDQEIIEVINTMLDKSISGAPVLNDNREIVGIISEKDCLRVIIDSAYYNQPISKGKVSDYMTRDITTISIDEDVVHAANMFLSRTVRRFPVVDSQGKLKGQVSRRDILKAAKQLHATTW